MKIKYISWSQKWNQRSKNKDAVFSVETKDYYLFLLFDWVSSSKNAIKAINYIKNFVDKNHNKYYHWWDFYLNKMIFDANYYLLSKGKVEWYTTCSWIIILPSKNFVKYINIWDSRIYMIWRQYIEQITNDDKLYPWWNIITKCLWMEISIDDINEYKKEILNDCNRFLVCSDWFYDLFEHNKIDFHKLFLMTYFASMRKNIDNKIKNNSDDASYIYIRII